MKDISEGVTVTIFGKEYSIVCPEAEREALLAAAGYLDAKMREVHASGKVLGAERTAVVTALNISNDLLHLRRFGGMSEEANQKLKFLQNKIDAALRWDVQVEQ